MVINSCLFPQWPEKKGIYTIVIFDTVSIGDSQVWCRRTRGKGQSQLCWVWTSYWKATQVEPLHSQDSEALAYTRRRLAGGIQKVGRTGVFLLIEVYLIHSVVLVSGVQHSDSLTRMYLFILLQLLFPISSVESSLSVVSNSLQPHESQHTRAPCPLPTLGVYPNSCPSSRWCHPAISSSVVPFSSCLQSLPASGSFAMSQLFTGGGQSTGVSASTSVLPTNTQDWSPSGRTDWISLQSKGLLRVYSNTTVQKHQFFITQLSSQSNSHIHTWPLEKP